MGKSICFCIPSLISKFSDAFVDFVVGGNVLGCETDFPPRIGKGWYEYYPESKLPPAQPIVSRVGAVNRIIAIGDFHGDLAKAKKALYLANLIDDKAEWAGDNTVLVQTGDIFDRGGDEIKIMYMLEKLKRQAQRVGGDVLILNGNHEFMNSSSVFSNASKAGFQEFCRWKQWYKIGEAFKRTCDHTMYSKPQPIEDEKIDPILRGRIEGLRPGGPFAKRFFANRPVILIVGNTVFVHAGVTTKHLKVTTPEEINELARTFFKGESGPFYPEVLSNSNSMVWTRDFNSIEDDKAKRCKKVKKVFQKLQGVERMVVGHCIQEKGKITYRCGKDVFLIDIGMSKGMKNSDPEVLEIGKDRAVSIYSFGLIHHFASGSRSEYEQKVPRKEFKTKSPSLDSSLELKDEFTESQPKLLKEPSTIQSSDVNPYILKFNKVSPPSEVTRHVGLAVVLPREKTDRTTKSRDTSSGTKPMDIDNGAISQDSDTESTGRITRSMSRAAISKDIDIESTGRITRSRSRAAATTKSSNTKSESPTPIPKGPRSPRSPRTYTSSTSPRKREREDMDPDYEPWQRAKTSRKSED